MNKVKIRHVAVIAIFSSLAVATPARAATSVCALDPETSWSAWFAWGMGYCEGYMG